MFRTEAHSDLEQDLNKRLEPHGRRCIVPDPIIEMVSKQVNFENTSRCERTQTLAGIRIFIINHNVVVCQKSSEQGPKTKSNKYRFIAVPTHKQGKDDNYFLCRFIFYYIFNQLSKLHFRVTNISFNHHYLFTVSIQSLDFAFMWVLLFHISLVCCKFPLPTSFLNSGLSFHLCHWGTKCHIIIVLHTNLMM